MLRTRVLTFLCLIMPLLMGGLCFVAFYPSIATKQKSISTGKELAKIYCASCHLFPEPDQLDKATWKNSVLPNMGMRLGIRSKDQNPFKNLDPMDSIIAKGLNIYPDEPLISKEKWDKIVAYYLEEAPEKLPERQVSKDSSNFNLPFISKFINIEGSKQPKVSLLEFDEANSQLYIGDYKTLYALDVSGSFNEVWELNSPASHIEILENSPPIISTLGSFGPSDQRLGNLSQLYVGENSSKTISLKRLQRPVYFESADFNMDGLNDVVVCNFGNFTGSLAWYDNYERSKENIIKKLPGARKIEVTDLNGDGIPDLVALMAQAYEKIIFLTNNGQGEFKEETILQFSPLHGASYFELVDFNNDGFNDLLVTNGDNWDFSQINKPYHGVRIYLNDGKNNFTEKFFFPMYGCSKAMANDFDGDGDLDIAAVSFYSDLSDPRESFVYLENEGNLSFKHSFLKEAVYGKWLTMEVGDFNKDSKPDVMLGSYFHNIKEMSKIIVSSGSTSFPQVLLLINQN